MYKVSDFYKIKEDDLFEGHYDVTLGPKWGEIIMARDSAEFFANIIYIFGKYQFHFTEKLSNEIKTKIKDNDFFINYKRGQFLIS